MGMRELIYPRDKIFGIISIHFGKGILFAKEKEDDDMRRRKEEYKQNNFNGNMNFTGKLKLQQEILSIISRKRSKRRQIMIQNQNGVVHLL